jgi:hypothetical protein
MANAAAPFGLRPSHTVSGAPFNGQTRMYRIPSTDAVAYSIGDVVTEVAGGDVKTGVSDVAIFGTRGATATSGNARGVIVGFASSAGSGGGQPVGGDPDNLGLMIIPATKSKDYYVYVCDDPNMIYEAQTNTIASSAFNKNTGLAVGAAPTATSPNCKTIIDGASATTTAALPIKIVGAPERIDNDLTAPGTNAWIWVMLNTSSAGGATAGV